MFWNSTSSGLFGAFMRTSAPELIQNGGFDSADNWTLGTNLSIGSGVLTATAAGSTRLATNTPAASIVAAATYRFVFTITARTGGTVTPNVGGTLGSSRNTVGTHSQDLVATNTNAPFLQFNTGAAMSVDNVSVRRL